MILEGTSVSELKIRPIQERNSFFSRRFMECCRMIYPGLSDDQISERRCGDLVYATFYSKMNRADTSPTAAAAAIRTPGPTAAAAAIRTPVDGGHRGGDGDGDEIASLLLRPSSQQVHVPVSDELGPDETYCAMPECEIVVSTIRVSHSCRGCKKPMCAMCVAENDPDKEGFGSTGLCSACI
jgi:hypothetical protein